MKGTILDFNHNEMVGLILVDDGYRYSFDLETDWQNKNNYPEINSSVNFIINENSATQIYSLSNKNLESIETKNNKTFANKSLKKIDFEKLKKELNNEENIKKTADAIINYKHDIITSSIVTGTKRRVNTKIKTTHKVAGVAIK